MTTTFDYHILGIPCQIRATISGKYAPAKVNAPPEHCHEAEYPDVDFEVLDHKGYPAPRLVAKLTDLARMNIEAECLIQAKKDHDDDC